mgnify:CR=1 FL=1
MKCSDVRKWISQELDGLLSDENRSVLTVHLESCEACREFRATLAELHSLHRTAGELDPPGSLLPSIMEAVEEESAGRTWTHGWLRYALPAAAAVVLVLGIIAGGNLTDILLPSNGSDAAEVFGLEYLEEHPPGSIGELMLAETEGGADDER